MGDGNRIIVNGNTKTKIASKLKQPH